MTIKRPPIWVPGAESAGKPSDRRSSAQGERDGRPASERTTTRVNGRFALILFVAVAVSAGAVHALHGYMVDRNADELRDRALLAEREGDADEAIRLLTQFVQFRPDDLDAKEQLVALLERTPKTAKSLLRQYVALEEILRKDPARDEARRRMIDLAVELRRWGDVEEHVDAIFARSSEPEGAARLVALKARSYAGRRQTADAVRTYLDAIRRDPSTVEPYAELIAVLDTDGEEVLPTVLGSSDRWVAEQAKADPAEPLFALFDKAPGETTAEDIASRVADLMVERAAPNWKALLARAERLQERGNPDAAAADVEGALAVPEAAEDARLLATAAAIEAARARRSAAAGSAEEAQAFRTAAIGYAERGLKADPPELRLSLLQSELALANGITNESTQAAEGFLRAGLERVPKQDKDSEILADQSVAETAALLRWTLADLAMMRVEQGLISSQEGRKTSEAVIEELGKTKDIRPELVEFLEARQTALNGDRAAAIQDLESVRLKVLDLPEVRRKADVLLGACYEALENPDRRIEVFRRALRTDRSWTAGRIALARALADAGRFDEALTEYAVVPNEPGAVWATVRLVLLRESQKPPAERDQDDVEAAVATVVQAAPNEVATILLQAEGLVILGRQAEAVDLLAKRSEERPESAELWLARFNAAAGQGDVPVADRIARAQAALADGEVRFGDIVEVRSAKAEAARLREGAAYEEEVSRLSENVSHLSREDQIRLYETLARHASQAGDVEGARSLWRKLAAIRPDDLSSWLALAQLSAAADDEASLREALEKIRAIEGSNGPNGNYVEAMSRLERISRDDDLLRDSKKLAAALAEPRELLKRAAAQRSDWAAIPRAQGALETLAGNEDAEFEYYERARQLGALSPEVVSRIVDHHMKQGRHDLAGEAFRQAELDQPGIVSGDLARMAGRTALERGDIDAAADWTRRAAEGSADPRDRLTYAHLLFVRYQKLPEAGRSAEAGKRLLDEVGEAYRKVVEGAPEETIGWVPYIAFLSQTGRRDEALQAIGDAERKLPATPAHVRLACLARCREAMGQADQAADLFRKAVEAAPDDTAIRMAAADYFSRARDWVESNRQLDQIEQASGASPEQLAWARRRRALNTASSGRYADVTRAIESLDQGTETSVADLQAQVVMMAGRATLRDRRKLVSVLEQLDVKSPLSEGQRLTLAALYESIGEWAKAEGILNRLLEKDGANAAYLSAYLIGAVRNRPYDESAASDLRSSLERLRAIEPQSLRTARAVAEFEAWADRRGPAGTAFLDFASATIAPESDGGEQVTPAERSSLRSAAEAAEALVLPEAAEELFRRYAEVSEQPEAALVWAAYLGRHSRYDEALNVVRDCRGRCKPDAVATAAATVVSLGDPRPEHFVAAEELVAEALQAEPHAARIVNALGGLRLAQGRYAEAETIYRTILAEQPNHVSALNNLAWLLALNGKDFGEARRLSDEAITAAGPLADLIDTRGVIRLAANEPSAAVEDLREAFADTPTGPVGFHLALAHERLGRREEARSTLAEAHRLGLRPGLLHVTEHDSYEELLMRLR